MPWIHCHPCDRDFVSNEALVQHQENNPVHNTCIQCDGERFPSRKHLIAHYIESHFYCATCKRFFDNQNGFECHLASSIHQPKTIRCIGGGCNKKFHCVSALTHHLESGACRSGSTRAVVNRIVVRLDGNNVITDPARLIRGPDGYGAPLSTPTYASESAWNGSAYECFLCHNEFRTLASLDRHLQSPTHEANIYRCPNREGCGREFPVLSALCQHVERDKCGVQRFRYAKDAIESLMVGLKRLKI